MTNATADQLYLSRLILNPHSRQVMSEMAQPYEMHRTLMRAFPEATDDTQAKAREEFGVLFRVEVDDLQDAIKVFVQSNIEPNWSILDELDYLHVGTRMPACECKDIMPAYQEIDNGQLLSFRLRANPTKRIAKRDDPMKGKRVELSREDEQIDWLARKGQGSGKNVPGGFDLLTKKVKDINSETQSVPHINIRSEGKQTGRKRSLARGNAMTHLAVVYEGLLRVTDKKVFLDTLVQGLGAGKAFGFGLISIAPVHNSDTLS